MSNSLTPTQVLLAQDFYSIVACDDSLFSGNPPAQRLLKSTIIRLLGLDTVSDKTYRFGQVPNNDVTDAWADLRTQAREALNETNNSANTDQADNSESSKDSEVREAVLRENV